MIVTTMAVSESNASVSFGGSSSPVDVKEGILPKEPPAASPTTKKPAVQRGPSYSEIDRLLDMSLRYGGSGEDSGHSESEAYFEDTLEPVAPSADFMVDLSQLTIEEARELLQHTKEQGDAQRAQNAQAQLAMRQKLSGLQGKLKRKLGMTSITVYTQAMKTTDTMPLPTYVVTNQIQLCRAFHVHEIYMNQIKKMQKRNKKLISFLTKQKKPIQEESDQRAAPLREKVDLAQAEVVRMCRILEINPDDWKKPEENEFIKRVSDVLTTGIPTMFNDWMATMSSQELAEEE